METTENGWKISLHGGHSGEFCEHAEGTLREILEAAVQVGYRVFGVAEHMPRVEERHLYPDEVRKGWTVADLETNFIRYAETIRPLARAFEGRLTILCGFEIEIVPEDRYTDLIAQYRSEYAFDYVVGSVHFINGVAMDSTSLSAFRQMVHERGGLEQVAVDYYRKVAEMVQAVRPEVVAHLDLIRLAAHRLGEEATVSTPRVRAEVERTLAIIQQVGSLVEINTAGLRKGLPTPYPDSWIVQMGAQMGVRFCIGDDSHKPAQVGFGLEQARQYLLANGVERVHFLYPEAPLSETKRARPLRIESAPLN